METFYELLDRYRKTLASEFSEFFKNHTNILYEQVNNPYDTLFFVGISDYKWDNLSDQGRRNQSQLYSEYKKFVHLLKVITQGLPAQEEDRLDEITEEVENYLLQNSRPYEKNPNEVTKKVINNLNEQFQIINNIHFFEEGKYVFVPDTNALLTNPDIENWKFDSVGNFQITLLPTVLNELDRLKVAHQNKDLREKANKIIKRIKEYRRRGKLTIGVTVTKNISLIALALEPDFGNTLYWLDSENNDDRILASFIEVCRINIRNQVCLVTSDINLQNKAEFANVPYCEPPQINLVD